MFEDYTHDDINVTRNRNIYVGGSDVPCILGISEYKTQYQLAKEKMGIEKTEFITNEYTKYGHIMEPVIRDYINSQYSYNFKAETIKNNEKHIRCNCDGMDEDMLLEIKTHGKVPSIETYISQMQLYMCEFNLKKGFLAMYEREPNFDITFEPERLKIEEIERDDKYIKKILSEIELFWKRCEKLKRNPSMTELEYMTCISIGNIDLPTIINETNKVELQLMQMKELENMSKKLKEDLYHAMIAYGIKSLVNEKMIVSRVDPTIRISVDSLGLKSNYPDIYDKCLKKSSVKGYAKITFRRNNDATREQA